MCILKAKLDQFSMVSGLTINPLKRNIFLAGISDELRSSIMHEIGFLEGALPVKYLGVPLSAGRISYDQCQELLAKISARVKAWGAYKLSYAGRLELVKSVLFSMHSYWSGMLILPKKVIKQIDSLCFCFIWGSREGVHKVHLLAWLW